MLVGGGHQGVLQWLQGAVPVVFACPSGPGSRVITPPPPRRMFNNKKDVSDFLKSREKLDGWHILWEGDPMDWREYASHCIGAYHVPLDGSVCPHSLFSAMEEEFTRALAARLALYRRVVRLHRHTHVKLGLELFLLPAAPLLPLLWTQMWQWFFPT